MNPKINRIILDKNNKEFMKYFKLAMNKQVKFEIYKIYWEKDKEHLRRVEYEFKKDVFKII